jgi:hypothetical protein
LAALAVEVFVVPVTDVSIGVLVLLHPVKVAVKSERAASRQTALVVVVISILKARVRFAMTYLMAIQKMV